MISKIFLSATLFLFSATGFVQNSSEDWRIEPLADLGFAENNGRYLQTVMNEDIEFYAGMGNIYYFFSEDAIVFGQLEKRSKEEYREIIEKQEKGEDVSDLVQLHFFKLNFNGTTAGTVLEPIGLKKHSMNFQDPNDLKITKRSKTFDQLVYKNIYEGINLILELPPSGGLKYSFEVTPGADYTQIIMEYSGADISLINNELNIKPQLTTELKDKAPISFVNDAEIASQFKLTDNKVSFSVAAYDETQTLIIDPWITTGLSFELHQLAYEVEYDFDGEVTILGNWGDQIAHYDNTGVLEWVWTFPGATPDAMPFFSPLGDITVDHGSGNIYAIPGFGGAFSIYRINAAGILELTHDFDFDFELQERWRLYFNETYDEIWIGGGNPISAPDLERMDADFGSPEAYNTLESVDFPMLLDAALLEMNLEEDTIYFLSCSGSAPPDWPFHNELNCVSRVDPLTIVWDTPTGHDFKEIGNLSYYPPMDWAMSGNGFNGIACGENFVYTYDGDMLQSYDKATGEIVEEITLGLTAHTHAGIDIDDCGNIYVGTNDSIRIYSTNLVQVGGILAPDTTYDLVIDGSKMYLSGYNYVAQLDLDNVGGDVSLSSESAYCSDCNGSATATIPEPPCLDYTFSEIIWSPGGETTETITGLCAGWYVINVIYVNEMGEEYIITDSVEVEDVELGLSVDVEIENEQCEGACNGNATFTPTTGEAPFSYDLDGEVNGTGVFEDLCVGTYTILVTDDNGCEFSSTITIESEEGLGLNLVTYNNPTCYGFSDGSITVETTGEVGEVTYEWDPENPGGGGTNNTLTAGVYTVYATSEFGCADSMVITLVNPDSLYATLTVYDIQCHGDATGIATVDSVYNAQGELENIAYFWAPNTFGAEGIGVDSAYNMPAGEYVITITDDNGCSFVDNFIINEPDELVFSEFGSYPALCRIAGYQNGNGVVFAAAAGGTADYEYTWLNLETLETSISNTWGGLNPGEYLMTATDANGCVITDIVQLDSINPIAAFTVESDQLDENCEGTELVQATFINQSTGFANELEPDVDKSFFWNLDTPTGNWIISHDINDAMDTSYVGEAIYAVCLVVQNENGCVDTSCKDIIVHVQPEFIAPNVFTPGDGINDLFTFEFKTVGISEFNCIIVNRWGREIAQLNTITDSWDGTDEGGNDVPDGVYFYTYNAISTNNTAFNGQGTVTLLRK
jgi:gliding motility-associated-like protein